MSPGTLDLQRFVRRIRLARGIWFLWRGLLAGSILGAVWAGLDLVGWTLADWRDVLALVAASGPVAGLWGWFTPVRAEQVARSVDRRSGLEDRLTSAIAGEDSEFQSEVREDAERKLSEVSPKRVYPIPFGRKQVAMASSVVLPVAILVVSYNHLLLSPDAREERKGEKADAARIEHVIKPISADKRLSPEETALVKKLERLQQELERGKLDRDSAKEKADRISQEAERLEHVENQKTAQSLSAAQSALDRMKQATREKNLDQADKSAGLTGRETEEQLKQLAAKAPTKEQLENLQQKISQLQKELAQKSGLSRSQRESLQKQLAELQKQMQQLQLSKAAQEMLERMRNNPEYKKLQEMMEKLRQNQQNMENGQPSSLSPEELKEMEQQLEELAKELKTDKDMENYIKQMEEALKEGNGAMTMQMLSMLMQNMGGAPDTTPGPPNGAHINMSDKEEKGLGKTHEIGIEADRKPTGQPAPYIEQKGLAKLTGPSSIPLLADVPASQRKAEEAIASQRIPKEHQERVKRYFEALEGRG